MTYEKLAKLAEAAGFSAWADLDVATIELKPEVREMCAANTCGQYGKRWSCPPGCGTLAECAERLRGFDRGILVQTYGDIEDGFDFEAMMEIEQEHRSHFEEMYAALREAGVQTLAIGANAVNEVFAQQTNGFITLLREILDVLVKRSVGVVPCSKSV